MFIITTHLGFRAGRRCQDNLVILDQVMRRAKTKGEKMFLAMLDITKAYDRVNRKQLWVKMRLLKYPEKLIRILEDSYRNRSVS